MGWIVLILSNPEPQNQTKFHVQNVLLESFIKQMISFKEQIISFLIKLIHSPTHFFEIKLILKSDMEKK